MHGRLWGLAIYVFVLGFNLNLVGIVSQVTISAFAVWRCLNPDHRSVSLLPR